MAKPKMLLAIDSGAHSIYNHIIKAKHGKGSRYSVNNYWKSNEFQEYVERYAEFLKSYCQTDVIDWYVSVDVIFDPEASWVIQDILESKGLNPMPVYHYGEDKKHLIKMMDNHEYIGIGGVGQDVSVKDFMRHGDMVFKLLSDDKGFPIRKTHGFALTSNRILWRYPFYTVDSSSWVQYSQYGIILLPSKRNGEWYFGKPFCTDGKPTEVIVSSRTTPKPGSKHHTELTKTQKKQLREWLEYLNIPIGKSEFVTVPYDYEKQDDEKFIGAKMGKMDRNLERRPIRGVINDHECRDLANYLYFMHLESKLPSWPWSSQRWTKPFNMRDKIELANGSRVLPQSTVASRPGRTRIIMGGNFDLQVYKHKEERMLRTITDWGFDYNRMVSFFFGTNNIFDGSDKIKNILEVKEEWLRNLSTNAQSCRLVRRSSTKTTGKRGNSSTRLLRSRNRGRTGKAE